MENNGIFKLFSILFFVSIIFTNCTKISNQELSLFTTLRSNLSGMEKGDLLSKYKAYSSELKSSLWKDKIQYVINNSTQLDHDQIIALNKVMVIINENLFTGDFQGLINSNNEVSSWIQNYSKLFSMDEGFSIFGSLENYKYSRQPSGAVRFDKNFTEDFGEKSASSKSKLESRTNNFVPPTCNCFCICRWNCPGDPVCVDGSQGCAHQGGCGWLFLQPCNGLCEDPNQ